MPGRSDDSALRTPNQVNASRTAVVVCRIRSTAASAADCIAGRRLRPASHHVGQAVPDAANMAIGNRNRGRLTGRSTPLAEWDAGIGARCQAQSDRCPGTNRLRFQHGLFLF